MECGKWHLGTLQGLCRASNTLLVGARDDASNDADMVLWCFLIEDNIQL